MGFNYGPLPRLEEAPWFDCGSYTRASYFPRQRNAGASVMSNVPSDAPRSFRSKPVRSSIEVVAKAARVALGLRNGEAAFEVPARLFEQLPFAVYLCDRDGLVLRFNRRAANYGADRPSSAIPMNGFV